MSCPETTHVHKGKHIHVQRQAYAHTKRHAYTPAHNYNCWLLVAEEAMLKGRLMQVHAHKINLKIDTFWLIICMCEGPGVSGRRSYAERQAVNTIIQVRCVCVCSCVYLCNYVYICVAKELC